MKYLKYLALPAAMVLPYKAFANPVLCPVCTFTIVGALGIAEFLGVSNNVVGIWVGAMLLAFSQWTVHFFAKRNIKKLWVTILSYAGWYSTLIALYMGKKPKICYNCIKIWGVDAFLFSVAVGTIIALFGMWLYDFLKKKNGGKPHFPYERVVLPVGLIVLVSLIFHFGKV